MSDSAHNTRMSSRSYGLGARVISGALFRLLCAFEPGYLVSGFRWRVFVCCDKAAQRPPIRELLGCALRHIERNVRTEFRIPSTMRRPYVRVFCGDTKRVSELSARFASRARDLWDGLYAYPYNLIFVPGPVGSAEWQRSIAHELCHALCYTMVGSRFCSPWADEGLAELLSTDATGNWRSPATRMTVIDEARRTLRATGLLGLLKAQASGGAPVDESAFTVLAGVFARFLRVQRNTRPRAWDTLLDAVAGRNPAAKTSCELLELAWAGPLCQIERDCADYMTSECP